MEVEQSAFILHSRPYRETSALVTFFTPEHGKLNGVVRGVRGGRKSSLQKAATIQPFQMVNLQWRDKPQSTSDLVSIKQIESKPLRFPLQGEANVCGLYVNELLYRLLFPRVSVEALFEHYQHTMYELLGAEGRNQQAWALRKFEYFLLAEMGHGFVCDEDINQQPVDADQMYFYYPQHGAVRADLDQQRFGVPVSGQCLLNLAEQVYSDACLPQLKKLFRATLTEYLGDKPIKTRELFQ